jgi:hypothetical protein
MIFCRSSSLIWWTGAVSGFHRASKAVSRLSIAAKRASITPATWLMASAAPPKPSIASRSPSISVSSAVLSRNCPGFRIVIAL